MITIRVCPKTRLKPDNAHLKTIHSELLLNLGLSRGFMLDLQQTVLIILYALYESNGPCKQRLNGFCTCIEYWGSMELTPLLTVTKSSCIRCVFTANFRSLPLVGQFLSRMRNLVVKDGQFLFLARLSKFWSVFRRFSMGCVGIRYVPSSRNNWINFSYATAQFSGPVTAAAKSSPHILLEAASWFFIGAAKSPAGVPFISLPNMVRYATFSMSSSDLVCQLVMHSQMG